ncbi:MAG: zinc-ribbon domain containing protein [Clostridia bacterium]|nr:zinc-ribbon domain containing protein [Clostridia bacterium]
MEDERLAREAEEAEKRKIEAAEKRKQEEALEKERKHQEYLAEKERRHQEWLAEKERRENTFEDKTLTCKKCGKEWIWTASEQKFFKEKGFFRPSMCKECRANTKVINNFHKA